MSLVNVYHLADLRVFFLCVCVTRTFTIFSFISSIRYGIMTWRQDMASHVPPKLFIS